MDQQINYRVNIDDANFQAKLTQMRASMDQTFMGSQMMGGMGGGGGGGGSGYASAAYAMNSMQSNFGPNNSTFSAYAPLSYTPPAIALEPHYGMVKAQQTFLQTLSGSLGMPSFNPLSGTKLPSQINSNDYAGMSQKNLVAFLGDASSTAITTAGSLATSYVGGTTGAWAGAAIGTAIMPGIGTVVGGLAGYFAGSAAADKLINPVVEGVTSRRQVQTDLLQSSYNFVTEGPDVDPRTGRGLSNRKAREEAVDLQIMSTEKGQVYNMKDLSHIQQVGISEGLYQGATTENDIAQKTRTLANTIKEMTSTLHQSIDESLQTLASYKDKLGVTDSDQAKSMSMQSSVLSRVAGLSPQAMEMAGFQGAAIVQGTGLNMSLYAEVNKENRAFVESAVNDKKISQEVVAQLGGKEATAQQLSSLSASAQQTDMGKMVKLALYDDKTGKMRSDYKEIMARGDFQEIQRLASKNAADPGILVDFATDEAGLITDDEMARTFSPNLNRMRAKATGIKGRRTGEKGTEYVVGRDQGLSDPLVRANMQQIDTAANASFAKKVDTSTAAEKRAQENAAADRDTSVKVLLWNPVQRVADAASMVTDGPQASTEDTTEDTTNKLKDWLYVKKSGINSSQQSADKAQIDKNLDPNASIGKKTSPLALNDPEGAPIARPSKEHEAASKAVIEEPLKQSRERAEQAAMGGTQPSSARSSGPSNGPSTGGSGSVALDTMQQVEAMGRSIEGHYKVLLNYAKQLAQITNKTP